MQRSQSDDIAWYASHGSGRVIRNLRSNAAVRPYSCTKAMPKPSAARRKSGERRWTDRRSPVLHVDRGLPQPVHLPCLSAAAVPVDVGVSECDKPQREVAAVETLRVPADRDDGL